MIISSKCMCSPSLMDKKEKILHKLKIGVGTIRIYAIVLSDGEDLFDIFNAGLFKQRTLRKMPYTLVGIANSQDEAITLITDEIKNRLLGGEFDKPSLKKEISDYFRG